MKKIYAILLTLAIVSGLSACSKKDVQYAKEPENVTVSKGTWTEGVYKNEFAGLEFKLPENFTKATDEELKSLNELSEGTYIYDMMCQNEKTGSNMIVMYEDVLDSFGVASVTAGEYLDATEEMMEQNGFAIEGRGKEMVSGKEYDTLHISVTFEGVKADQHSFVRKEGNYIISVIIAVMGEDSIESVMKNFI